MNWFLFLKKLLRNWAVMVVVVTLLLGALGYVLGGQTGMLNLATWGFWIAMFAGLPYGLGLIIMAHYWGSAGNYRNLGEWAWFIQKPRDEHPEPK